MLHYSWVSCKIVAFIHQSREWTWYYNMRMKVFIFLWEGKTLPQAIRFVFCPMHWLSCYALQPVIDVFKSHLVKLELHLELFVVYISCLLCKFLIGWHKKDKQLILCGLKKLCCIIRWLADFNRYSEMCSFYITVHNFGLVIWYCYLQVNSLAILGIESCIVSYSSSTAPTPDARRLSIETVRATKINDRYYLMKQSTCNLLHSC